MGGSVDSSSTVDASHPCQRTQRRTAQRELPRGCAADAVPEVIRNPTETDAKRTPELIQHVTESPKPTRKGDVTLLSKADGNLYKSVDFPTAESYADISPRRRQQLMADEVLKVLGQAQNRRITVESLLEYCPPIEDAK